MRAERVKAEPDARQKEKLSFWGFTRGRRYEGKEAYVTQELQDLVRIATVAHRKGKGELVWYSWVGAPKKKTVPSHGSTLVGVSKDGAIKLLEGHGATSAPAMAPEVRATCATT